MDTGQLPIGSYTLLVNTRYTLITQELIADAGSGTNSKIRPIPFLTDLTDHLIPLLNYLVTPLIPLLISLPFKGNVLPYLVECLIPLLTFPPILRPPQL